MPAASRKRPAAPEMMKMWLSLCVKPHGFNGFKGFNDFSCKHQSAVSQHTRGSVERTMANGGYVVMLNVTRRPDRGAVRAPHISYDFG